jgi:hypothetical protein
MCGILTRGANWEKGSGWNVQTAYVSYFV